MDLVEFLTARYDEEEALALACTSRDWVARDATVRGGPVVDTAAISERAGYKAFGLPDQVGNLLPPEGVHARPDDFWVMVNLHGTTGKFESEIRNAKHIAYWDPSRVLADIATKRAILDSAVHLRDLSQRLVDKLPEGLPLNIRTAILINLYGSCRVTLKQLAAPYQSHLDFDPAWRTV